MDGQWYNVGKFTETQLPSMTYCVKKNLSYQVQFYQHSCTPNNASRQDMPTKDCQACEIENFSTPKVPLESQELAPIMPHLPAPEHRKDIVMPQVDAFPAPEQALPVIDSI